MSPIVLDTPVVLIVFNRPETTERVFSSIRNARPSRLLVVADGPRKHSPTDHALCAKVRQIVEQVDWPCEVSRNYSETNRGCKHGPASGISWAFEQVDEAIILEDDCLPHPDFFSYCQDMLARYRDDDRVMTVCGTNLLGKWRESVQGYHFSSYDIVWGWASWSRAWKHYDITMKSWGDPDARTLFKESLPDQGHYRLWAKGFQQVFDNRLDAWDYQWTFARLLRHGLAVVPSVNLISNIGFSPAATHTKLFDQGMTNLATYPLASPLPENCNVIADHDYDSRFIRILKHPETFLQKIRYLLWGLRTSAKGS